MIKILSRILYRLENSRESLIYFISTFFFTVSIRIFLEIYLNHYSSNDPIYYLSLFAHYILWYIVLTLILLPIFSRAAKTSLPKIARTILPIFIITATVPFFDLIYKQQCAIGYLNPTDPHIHLLNRFFSFLGSCNVVGATLGIKIEIAIILLLSLFYFWNKIHNIFKSFFYTAMVYVVMFILAIIPFHFLWLADMFNVEFSRSNSLYISYYLILIVPLVLLNFYLCSKEKYRIILSDIRLTRLIYFFLMFVFGAIVAIKIHAEPFTLNNIFHGINLVGALVFACLFSAVTNNIADYKIDQISNNTRPLFNKDLDHNTYKNIGWLLLIAALLYSLSIDLTSISLIISFIALYFLYSMPPFRFKKYILVSKFFISFNSILAALLGFNLFHGNLQDFPKNIFIYILLFALPINFIDIKDYLGDKAEKIMTLPTLLGLKRSQWLIAIFWFGSYLSSYLIVKNTAIIIPALIMGSHQCYLLTKKDYEENPVFYNLYLSFGFFLFLYFQK